MILPAIAAVALIAAWWTARSPRLCAAWLRFDGLPTAWCAPLARGIPAFGALDLAFDAAVAGWAVRLWARGRGGKE